MNLDAEKSFKAKLRAIAREKNRDPADLWQSLTLERFLARLAVSDYANYFILKGGTLLSKYIDIGRETTDLDFLAQKVSHEIATIQAIFETIAAIDLKDGFSFRDVTAAALNHLHMSYSGVELSLVGYFIKTRFKVFIDIGFGDIVNPITYSIALTRSSQGTLFEDSIKLYCYPKEFIFAEKLETILYRGSFNSRMKDFHDLYSMINSPDSFFHDLESIICMVFKHRQTSIALPLVFTEEELVRLQAFWNEYLKSLAQKHLVTLPTTIVEVIETVNQWLCSHTQLLYGCFEKLL